MFWVRTCQEYLHRQKAQKPSDDKPLSDSYRNSKCRNCKSESLDYGKEMDELTFDRLRRSK